MCESCLPTALLTRPSGSTPTTFGHSARRRSTSRPRPGPVRAPVDVADLVIRGGPILTMDSGGSRPEAVAVSQGRIAALGTAEEMGVLTGPTTEVLDLDGRVLLPGLIDPHMHAAMLLMADWVDVSPMTTPTADAVVATLRAAPATETGWVLAHRFDPSITAGHPDLDREALDALSPDRPMLVLEGNGHIAHVNSAALHAAGVDGDRADPPTARFVRDAAGEPTGRIEEMAAIAAFAMGMPIPTHEGVARQHRGLFDFAASKGVTLLHDCGIGMVGGRSDYEVLREVVDANSPVRYRGMLVSTSYDKWCEMGLTPGVGDDMLRITGIKAWSDGSNQAATGYQREPYLGSEARGALNYTADELADVVERAHRDGWQVGVHANGDAAIDVTIDAFERALRAHPRADHRHRIEHCSVLHTDQIQRMAGLGLSPSFLIGHVRWWGRAFRDRLLGAERADCYDPCASALAAGLRISLHSDWDVTPMEPLRYVEDAVTRRVAEGGDVLNPDECIGVDAALRAVTIDAAWQCGADDITGSLEVGKYADLVLLEDDPTTVDPGSISSIGVSGTRLAGEVRYSA